jgi:hypothetical protein
MNIKSLLIGSTAALVAVSGARAADAIVAAEPEPVEYVRVCDAFGTGFFYIPGTETCLKIDGYVRFRVTATKGTTGYTQNTRARLNFDARSETELGTLRGYIRFQSNSGNAFTGDANVVQDQAMLQLGGLFMGYTESAFAALWGGGVGNFGVIQTDNGGIYSYQQRQQIGYRYDAGAFYAALVLEHDTNPTNNWAPDVVGVLGMTQGWGGADVRVCLRRNCQGSRRQGRCRSCCCSNRRFGPSRRVLQQQGRQRIRRRSSGRRSWRNRQLVGSYRLHPGRHRNRQRDSRLPVL